MSKATCNLLRSHSVIFCSDELEVEYLWSRALLIIRFISCQFWHFQDNFLAIVGFMKQLSNFCVRASLIYR